MADKDLAHSSADDVHRAATAGERIRVRGAVVDRGHGYSGTYSNSWLQLDVGTGRFVRITCSNTGRLAALNVGDDADIALTLTGMVDVIQNVYFGARPRLMAAGI